MVLSTYLTSGDDHETSRVSGQVCHLMHTGHQLKLKIPPLRFVFPYLNIFVLKWPVPEPLPCTTINSVFADRNNGNKNRYILRKTRTSSLLLELSHAAFSWSLVDLELI